MTKPTPELSVILARDLEREARRKEERARKERQEARKLRQIALTLKHRDDPRGRVQR